MTRMTWSSSEFCLGSSWGLEIDLLHESLTRRRFAHTSEWPEQHKDWLARSSSLVDHHDRYRRSSTTELKNLKGMFVVMKKILEIQSCYETASKLQRKAWKIHEHFGALTGRDRRAWPLCDRVVSRDVEEVPLSRSLGTFRDDFSLALTFYVLTTVSCVRLCNDKIRTYLRVKALSQFYSLTAGSSWPPRTTLNSCVVFAKILDQRDDRVFYPNFLMDEFSISLPHISFIFVSFMHFCTLFIKFLPCLKKSQSLSRIVVMFWSKLLTSCSVTLTLKFLNLSLKIPWKHLEFSTEKIVRTLDKLLLETMTTVRDFVALASSLQTWPHWLWRCTHSDNQRFQSQHTTSARLVPFKSRRRFYFIVCFTWTFFNQW